MKGWNGAALTVLAAMNGTLNSKRAEGLQVQAQLSEAIKLRQTAENKLQYAETARRTARTSFKAASRQVNVEQTADERRSSSSMKLERTLGRMDETTTALRIATNTVKARRLNLATTGNAVVLLNTRLMHMGQELQEMQEFIQCSITAGRKLMTN